MSTTEEDKPPTPSGRPRPGSKPPQKKQEEKPIATKEELVKSLRGRGLALTLVRDYRFWIVVISFTLGFLAGKF